MALTHLTAFLYLLAGVVSAAGVVLPRPLLRQLAVGVLAAGAVSHGFHFFSLHAAPPPLTDLDTAVSFMGWVGSLFFLAFVIFLPRLAGLAMLVGPMAFLGVFFESLPLPSQLGTAAGSPALSHSHVLLASTGLSLLGVAGLAGLLLLLEDRRLKAKRPLGGGGVRLPSLESLDKVNALSLAVGFPLLTLGVVSGSLWLRSIQGTYWSGSPHEIWCAVGWLIYVALVVARFGTGQGARASAVAAVGGFGFLLVAVVGVGMLA